MVKAHKVVDDEMIAFLDDKGLAYRIEAAEGVTMERQ